MIVHQIYTDNNLRNFNYIIACDKTKEAIVIDPLRVDLILDVAKKNNYNITKIINTHEHADHTDGNLELIDKTNAEVFCHHKAVDTIPGAKYGLVKNTVISLGHDINIIALDTPGHTKAHVCLLAEFNNTKAIFSGDTLFNAGAGNVYSGNVEDLYNTFVDILFKLPDDTKIYPGHDYLENNLKFTLSCEPNNQSAIILLEKIKDQDPHNAFITNLAIEKNINTFFRLDNKEIINNLSNKISNFTKNPTNKDVFIGLREVRNSW